jgi:hypothetical protein
VFVSVVVNLRKGILLYTSDGWSFYLNEAFRLKRLKKLDIDTDRGKYVGPRPLSFYTTYPHSVLRIQCWGKPPFDQIVVDLESMSFDHQGKDH